MSRLTHDFFDRNPVSLARDLIGCFFVHKTGDGIIKGKIIETEAYGDEKDLASHARFGHTKRNAIMYGSSGFLYVYHIYGIFYLTNIICQKAKTPSAVLIRAAEVVEGKEIAKTNIDRSKFVKSNDLMATGPGKFSLAFGIDKSMNHLDIIQSKEIFVENKTGKIDIMETDRVGIDYAGESKELLWRFYDKNSKFVSKK